MSASYSENLVITMSVSIIDDENSAAFSTVFKSNSPVPAKKAKVLMPKNLSDFPEENENKMDATNSNYIAEESFQCTETINEEFSGVRTPNKPLNDVTGNLNRSLTSAFESQFTYFDDAHLESLKKEFDLNSINSDELVDLDFDDICDELSNMLNDDFPLEESKTALTANLNNTLKRSMGKPLEINLESYSTLSNSHKDLAKNQQDSRGIISEEEFSKDSSYEKTTNRSGILNEEAVSIISDDSLFKKEHLSHTTFAESKTVTHTLYTKCQIALARDRVKLNYDSDSCDDGCRKIGENQTSFNDPQITNKAICALEENRSITDRKCDEKSISFSSIGSENMSYLDKVKVTHTEDALLSTASDSDKKCVISTTLDIKFPFLQKEIPIDDSNLKVQNTSIKTYKEKEDMFIKNGLAKVTYSIYNNTNVSDKNGHRKTSENGLAKTTLQIQNNCLGSIGFKLCEVVPNSSKNINEMESTCDDANRIRETPDFVKTVFKPSTKESHQLQKNAPNGSETVEFRCNSENPDLFSSLSTLRKNPVVDCFNVKTEPLSDTYEITNKSSPTMDKNSSLNFRKNFENKKLEKCCRINLKTVAGEVSSNNTVAFSHDSQNSFHTQANIEESTDLHPIAESEPSRKEPSNLLSTDIDHKHLKDLYDIDKSIAQAVLISIYELDRKNGVKQSQILKYIKQNQMIQFHPKLHLEVSKFLTTACEVGIIKKKAFKYALSDQVQAIAAEHKMEETKVKHLTRSRRQKINIIEKNLSSPIHSPKLLRYNRAHLKHCSM